MQFNVKYPRLYAALAVTGMLNTAAAESETPACISMPTYFGSYNITTEYHLDENTNTGEYRVGLERDFDGDSSTVHSLVDDGNLRNVLNNSWLGFDLYFSEKDGEISATPSARSLYVGHQGSSNNRSKIVGGAVTTNNDRIYPVNVTPWGSERESRSHFAAWHSDRAYNQWRRGESVTVTLYFQDGEQQRPYARIVLEPGEWDQVAVNSRSQIAALAYHHEKGNCKPVSSSTTDDECFLTTASTECLGLSDDCWELETLRYFRDYYLLRTAVGTELVSEYYAIAPNIVRHINAQPDAYKRWLNTYWSGILPTAMLVRLGMHRLAQRAYHRMVKRLQASLVA